MGLSFSQTPRRVKLTEDAYISIFNHLSWEELFLVVVASPVLYKAYKKKYTQLKYRNIINKLCVFYFDRRQNHGNYEWAVQLTNNLYILAAYKQIKLINCDSEAVGLTKSGLTYWVRAPYYPATRKNVRNSIEAAFDHKIIFDEILGDDFTYRVYAFERFILIHNTNKKIGTITVNYHS